MGKVAGVERGDARKRGDEEMEVVVEMAKGEPGEYRLPSFVS